MLAIRDEKTDRVGRTVATHQRFRRMGPSTAQPSQTSSLNISTIASLQRSAGNAAVVSLLGRTGPTGLVQRCGPVPCDCPPEKRALHAAKHAGGETPAEQTAAEQAPTAAVQRAPTAAVPPASPLAAQQAGSAPAAGPSGACAPEAPRVLGGDILLFQKGSAEYASGQNARTSAMQDGHIAAQARGAASIRIYGNASREGPAALNARLACQRAERVAADLAADGTVTATISLFAHGATTTFSAGQDAEGPGQRPSERLRALNRNVEVVFEPRPSPTPQPTPPRPGPPAHVCGPDVDAQLTAVLSGAQAYFRPLSSHRKNIHCRWLVVPPMAIMAWDVHQLFLPETGWLRSLPFSGPCGRPTARADVEDPATCSNTVRVGGKCNLAGTVNYATAGVLWRLCHDFYDAQPWWGYADLLGDFTERGMLDYIELWKTVDWDDAGPPTAFATAAYRGGPAARPSTENRAHCTGHCPVTSGVPAFTFRWNPFHD